MSRLRAVLHNRYVEIAGATIMFVAAVFEMLDTAVEQTIGKDIGAEHGIAVFAGLEALKRLSKFFESTEAIGRITETAIVAEIAHEHSVQVHHRADTQAP